MRSVISGTCLVALSTLCCVQDAASFQSVFAAPALLRTECRVAPSISSSQLSLSSIPQEPAVIPSSSATQTKRPRSARVSSNEANNLPEWAQRPLRRRGNHDPTTSAALLDQAELIVGRAAMLGATVLLVQELFTGESILEQCRDALGTLSQWH